jgi:hypothetical protein
MAFCPVFSCPLHLVLAATRSDYPVFWPLRLIASRLRCLVRPGQAQIDLGRSSIVAMMRYQKQAIICCDRLFCGQCPAQTKKKTALHVQDGPFRMRYARKLELTWLLLWQRQQLYRPFHRPWQLHHQLWQRHRQLLQQRHRPLHRLYRQLQRRRHLL